MNGLVGRPVLVGNLPPPPFHPALLLEMVEQLNKVFLYLDLSVNQSITKNFQSGLGNKITPGSTRPIFYQTKHVTYLDNTGPASNK